IYVDGRLSDSLWLGPNSDPALYIGSYVQSYNLTGTIEEVLLYDRYLADLEVSAIHTYEASKYNLPTRPIPLLRDSTFLALPAPMQFFPRDRSDSAMIVIAGTMHTPGFDSIRLETFRNDTLLRTTALPLRYMAGAAPFQLS